MPSASAVELPHAIAIVGVAGRFPGAKDLDELWANLRDGVESVRFFTDEELIGAGADPADVAAPGFVPANAMLEGIEDFDASFFRYSPREAEIMDPQHRLFLELAWHALESAGYDPRGVPGAVAVYAGTEMSTYLLRQLGGDDRVGLGRDYDLMIGNTKDFLPLRVSYRLGLTGPSVCVQTACSTSLVAVHMACQSLLTGESDLALAGGVTVSVPQVRGYVGSEDGILSPDGHCRPFDARARGTLTGNGLGIVVLKRLDDALRDGDTVRAVIRGSAVNNDGSLKAGFTAPSVQAQAAVIAEALAVAGVDADSIGFVEAHGTGTELGDPVEVAALTRAFLESTDRRQFCALGSVKSNFGHLDAAAGIAGLIKAVLALEHRAIPPTLHFSEPNPAIGFPDTPFFVNTSLRAWEANGSPRRAGVSSFGIGGTNAHVVLEEAPAPAPAGPSRPYQLLVLSARTETALDETAANLARHLAAHPELDLADVAHTLRVGRSALERRRSLVCRTREEAIEALGSGMPGPAASGKPISSPAVGFLFSGQGAQYAGMARELYDSEPVFRAELDRSAELLGRAGVPDLLSVVRPAGAPEEAAERLRRTAVAQPALFAVEHALAKLWASLGIRPAAMLGHSIGEYVAACLAGVFSLEDALRIVAARGRLMQSTADGAMLAVGLSETATRAKLGPELAVAAVNAADQCVVSGPPAAVDELADRLRSEGIASHRLRTTRAFHSGLVEPVLADFERVVADIELRPPDAPYVSNVTGTWVTEAEATSPAYWARHAREPVRFADGLDALWQSCDVLVEVGPGDALAALARRHPARPRDATALAGMRRADATEHDGAVFLRALGELWVRGFAPDWASLAGDERRRRVGLPTYPFERGRYWIEAAPRPAGASSDGASPEGRRRADRADWFGVPIWKQAVVEPASAPTGRRPWLVFVDGLGLGHRVAERLRESGREVVTVAAKGEASAEGGADNVLDPGAADACRALVETVGPEAVVHLWSVTESRAPSGAPPTPEEISRAQLLGFDSLVSVAQALGDRPDAGPVRVTVVSNDMQLVTGEESSAPEKATVLGPCRVAPLENRSLRCASVDVAVAPDLSNLDRLAGQLARELTAPLTHTTVAYRGRHRWVQAFEPVRIVAPDRLATGLRERGVYLVTGGLSGVGLAIAEHLASTVRARLVLVGRGGLPPESEWNERTTTDGADPMSDAIRRILQMREAGADVLVAAADVSDVAAMREVVATAREAFGAVNGVVHAAGVPGSGFVREATRDSTGAVLAPKVTGTLVLWSLLAGEQLDFFVLMSSHSSLVGDVGQVDYAAANAFLDAFAHHRHLVEGGPRVVSINWDTWRERGMAVRHLRDLQARLRGDDGRQVTEEDVAEALSGAGTGLSTEEGLDALERVLARGLPQVVVAPRGLDADALGPGATPSAVETAANGDGTPRTGYARPALDEAYAPPETPAEQQIAAMWQELLGIERVGVRDDFFELGGHSLLATQLVSRVEESFGVTLPLQALFESRTVQDVAQYVELARWAGAPSAVAATEHREEGAL